MNERILDLLEHATRYAWERYSTDGIPEWRLKADLYEDLSERFARMLEHAEGSDMDPIRVFLHGLDADLLCLDADDPRIECLTSVQRTIRRMLDEDPAGTLRRRLRSYGWTCERDDRGETWKPACPAVIRIPAGDHPSRALTLALRRAKMILGPDA
ncbi:hypothetical protein [Bifidobacterium sp. SO1]|uniref:hypothetical protein n=1 Tax=Bifidobacterium sp. SO1 TaxID=2809029 RepID=UPI001BDBD11A|nr:hypothetical protein [Bifidobacterium sp. SO1]MBT1161703.1 hypothetical protein [Bifidobacterium sp. SO1]